MAENLIKSEQTGGYWYNWIISAKASAKQHWDISTRAWNEYLLAESPVTGAANTVITPPARFPLFWSSIKNLQPAYYARTPETVARRMYESEDHVARVACLILERLSKYSMSQYPIDDAMIHATLDFLIADKATARIYLEEIREKFTEEIQVYLVAEGSYIDANSGEVIPEDAEIALQPDGITYTAKVEREQLVKVCTDVLPVPFSDILHTPNAQSWCDVKTVAFRLWLDKQDFVDKFGIDKLKNVVFNKQEQKSDSVTKNENEAQPSQDVGNGIEIWEIWDKPTKKVIYLAKNEILQVLKDPYELRDFFPCAPFILGTKPPKSLYPTPMYKQLEPMIDQLHRLFTRITKMTSGLRRRGIADKAMTDVIEAINQLEDFEIIGSSHFQQLVESKAKGTDPIWYLPLAELAQALAEAQELLASYKQLFFEISGVPDVVRGVTDYRETASAQQSKGEFYNVRSSWDQHLIQEMARKLIEMQCDLALARMPEAMIIEVCHLQSLQPEDIQYVSPALQLLKNDKQRSIRIDIETDSLTFVQSAKKQEQKNVIVQTVMEGLKQVASIGKDSPEFLRPAMQMLMMSLRGIDLGKDYEQSVESAMKGLEEASKNPAPPPPDYEGLKLQVKQQELALKQGDQQLKAQLAQQDTQMKQMQAQFDNFMKQQELMLKGREVQQSAERDQADIALGFQELQVNASIAGQEAQAKQVEVQANATDKMMKQGLEQEYLNLEKSLTGVNVANMMADNKRLEQSAMNEQAKGELEAVKILNEAKRTGLDAEKLELDKTKLTLDAVSKLSDSKKPNAKK